MSLQTLIRRATAGTTLRSFNPTRRLSVLGTAPRTPQSEPSNSQKVKLDSTQNDTCNVEFYEHCKSGSDRQVAEMKEAAYGKGATEPDEVLMVADGESKNLGHTSNPLDVSSANPGASEACESSLERSGKGRDVQGNGMIKGVTTKQGHIKKYG